MNISLRSVKVVSLYFVPFTSHVSVTVCVCVCVCVSTNEYNHIPSKIEMRKERQERIIAMEYNVLWEPQGEEVDSD